MCLKAVNGAGYSRSKIKCQRLGIKCRFAGDGGMSQQGFDLAGEDQEFDRRGNNRAASCPGDHAQQEVAFFTIPQGKANIRAVFAAHQLLPAVEFENGFGCRCWSERTPSPLASISIGIVVNLAVVGDGQAAIGGPHGQRHRQATVENGEAAGLPSAHGHPTSTRPDPAPMHESRVHRLDDTGVGGVPSKCTTEHSPH